MKGGHEVLFRLLLRLYPDGFRAEYGEEMTALFRRRLDRAMGRSDAGADGVVGMARVAAVVRLWWRTLGDALVTAVALRRRAGQPHRAPGRAAARASIDAASATPKSPPTHGRREDRMDSLLQDIRHAFRRLAKAPGFTAGAIGLLAIGIGVNTSVFTLADALLFRAPPWSDPDRVVFVYQDSDDGDPSSSSYPATRDMARSEVFEAVAAISPGEATWERDDGPTRASIEYVTASYLDVLGLSVTRGRWFGPEDDEVGEAPKAVVSEATWRTRFGARPDIVGHTIRLGGQPVTVIGVGPAELVGTYAPLRTDFWLSIASTVVGGPFRVANLERRQDHWYDVRARLAEGVTVARARSAMDGLAARLAEAYPALNEGRDITVFASDDVRLHPSEDEQLYLAGGLLGALAALVLLLTAANLANLLLVRGLNRSGEMAVRRALGARRGRVVRIFLAESVALAVAGGALGVGLAFWVVSAIPGMPVDLPLGGGIDLAIDGRVIAFSLALIALTGVLFGMAPALRSTRDDVAGILRDDRASVGGGRSTLRLRNALVAAQVAASLVLVLGAGLLGRSLAALGDIETGVDADRVAYVRADFGPAGLDGDALRQARDLLVERVRALPGVAAAGITSQLPASFGGTTTTLVEGYTPASGTDAVEMAFAVVGPGYFEAMGIPLVDGRLFQESDGATDAPRILVNQASVRRFWPGESALGRRNRGETSETWRTVVGVVGDAPVSSLAERDRPIMYFSDRASNPTSPWIVARTDGAPAALLPALRQAVEELPYAATVTDQGTLAGHFGEALDAPRFGALLLAAFSVLAVVLAGLGIYAVVAFSVVRRSAEVGIRMALGARRGDVVGMLVREVALTVAVGLAAGLALAFPITGLLQGTLYGIDARDPLTAGAAVVFILAMALAAAWLPARRAARTDPVRALRAS